MLSTLVTKETDLQKFETEIDLQTILFAKVIELMMQNETISY